MGYQGTGPLTRALPLFAAIGVAGGILAAAGAAVGHALSARLEIQVRDEWPETLTVLIKTGEADD